MATTNVIPEATGLHEMRIADCKHGDIKITWGRGNTAEVEMARAAFERAKKERMLIYKLGRDDRSGEILREFDPDAERIIAVPQPIGG